MGTWCDTPIQPQVFGELWLDGEMQVSPIRCAPVETTLLLGGVMGLRYWCDGKSIETNAGYAKLSLGARIGLALSMILRFGLSMAFVR